MNVRLLLVILFSLGVTSCFCVEVGEEIKQDFASKLESVEADLTSNDDAEGKAALYTLLVGTVNSYVETVRTKTKTPLSQSEDLLSRLRAYTDSSTPSDTEKSVLNKDMAAANKQLAGLWEAFYKAKKIGELSPILDEATLLRIDLNGKIMNLGLKFEDFERAKKAEKPMIEVPEEPTPMMPKEEIVKPEKEEGDVASEKPAEKTEEKPSEVVKPEEDEDETVSEKPTEKTEDKPAEVVKPEEEEEGEMTEKKGEEVEDPFLRMREKASESEKKSKVIIDEMSS
jgi:hypothetical protein